MRASLRRGAEVVVRIVWRWIVGMVCVALGASWAGVCLGAATSGASAYGSVRSSGEAEGPPLQGQAGGVGNVQGKVVQEGNSLGIRKVLVQLEGGGETRSVYVTSTDGLGQFRFEGVLAGEYVVTISRAGFVPTTAKTEAQTIKVVAGQEVTGLVYRMQATGVITGKITEADGDPLQGVTVWVTRVGKNGEPANDANGPAEGDAGEETTNDLGEYRIANLHAGQYIVQAQAHGMGPAPDPADRGKSKERPIYALTYYPGTLEMKQASVVQVLPGVTATANFPVMTSGVYRVSGTVQVTGNPRNMQIFLVSATGQTEVQQLGEGGRFEFQNILPGTYVAQVVDMNFAGDGGSPAAKTRIIASPIVVTDADVSGLQLQVEAGGSVSGKVHMDEGENPDWTRLELTLLRVADTPELPQLEHIGALGGNAAIQEDGSFALKDVAGATYQVAMATQSEEFHDYYVKSVMLDGREVADTGFRVSGDTTLEVVMSAKGASIEGTVMDSKGRTVAGAMVASLPASGKLGRPDSYQTEKTDANGHFVMRGMNPGTYVLVALEEMPEDVRKPEFFQKYGEKGVSVELEEGDRKSLVVGVEEEKE
jgi:Carboxypeptidase regulatory-like domain